MRSGCWHRAALVGASFFFVATLALATPQVVGDGACERHEVDIASFASCVDGKVVQPAPGANDEVVAAAHVAFIRFARFDLEPRHRAALALAGMERGTGTGHRVPAPDQGAVICNDAPAAPLASAQMR